MRGFLIRIYNFILKYNDKKNLFFFFIKVLKLKIIVIIFYNFKWVWYIKCFNKVVFIELNFVLKLMNSLVCKIDIELN